MTTKMLPEKIYRRCKRYERLLAALRADYPRYIQEGRADKAARLICRARLICTPLWVRNQKP